MGVVVYGGVWWCKPLPKPTRWVVLKNTGFVREKITKAQGMTERLRVVHHSPTIGRSEGLGLHRDRNTIAICVGTYGRGVQSYARVVARLCHRTEGAADVRRGIVGQLDRRRRRRLDWRRRDEAERPLLSCRQAGSSAADYHQSMCWREADAGGGVWQVEGRHHL